MNDEKLLYELEMYSKKIDEECRRLKEEKDMLNKYQHLIEMRLRQDGSIEKVFQAVLEEEN